MMREVLSPENTNRRLAHVSNDFQGDLDRIVAKATATDPNARYASASQFADDLRRHLAGDPVLAELQSPRERIVRTIRRRKRAFISILAAAVFLLLTTGVSLDFAQRAQREARLANLSAAARALDDADLMLVSQHEQALGAHDGTLERDVLARECATRRTHRRRRLVWRRIRRASGAHLCIRISNSIRIAACRRSVQPLQNVQ
jgi:hypothetical protein